jgi:hypothetical protein
MMGYILCFAVAWFMGFITCAVLKSNGGDEDD